MTARVRISVDEAVATIRIERPEVRNAIDSVVLRELEQGITHLEQSDVRVILVGGGSNAAIAGGDLSEMRDLTEETSVPFLDLAARVFRLLGESPLVSIAVIGDYALGGGTELALACDLRVARTDSALGLPEVRVGVLPGWGGTQRLARVVGPGRAMELILSARRITGTEAERIGLVSRLCEEDGDVWHEARSLADDILAGAPAASVFVKRVINQAGASDLDDGLKRERQAWLANLSSPDRVEGMRAFLERRDARWVTRNAS